MEKNETQEKDTGAASAARETFMLKITKAIEHLEMDRASEFENELCEALSNYSPPEIYVNIDIELASELKKLDDSLSVQQRVKFHKELVNICKELSKVDCNTPIWLKKYAELIFSSRSSLNDPYRLVQIRDIQQPADSLEMDFILATALIQEGIRTDDENCFIESESIFNLIEPILDEKEELPKRYRIHFPKDPRQTLAIFRIWGAQNYSVFFQRKERLADAIEIMEDLLKQKWVKSSGEIEKLQTKLSILQVLEMSVKMINDERVANEIKLKETASGLENKWTTFLGIFLAAAFLTPMLSGMVLHLGFDELKKIIPLIGLTTVLIVNLCFIFVCHEWKRFLFLFSCASVIILIILFLL